MNYIEEIKEEILKLKEQNKLIIVEGKKDVSSLKKLGLKNVMEIKGALFETVEAVEDKEVVILTDIDEEGKKLYSKLKRQLIRRGVKIDNALRHFLFRAKVSHVEGLYTYLKNGNIKRRKD